MVAANAAHAHEMAPVDRASRNEQSMNEMDKLLVIWKAGNSLYPGDFYLHQMQG